MNRGNRLAVAILARCCRQPFGLGALCGLAGPTGLSRLAGLVLTFALAFGFGADALAAVDANTATTAELDAINGIGPALAARIVEERRKAPFRSLADLQSRVRGVGEANLRKMRDSGLSVGPARGAGGTETIVGGAETNVGGARSASASGAARRTPRSVTELGSHELR